jgi:hypothetical protein
MDETVAFLGRLSVDRGPVRHHSRTATCPALRRRVRDCDQQRHLLCHRPPWHARERHRRLQARPLDLRRPRAARSDHRRRDHVAQERPGGPPEHGRGVGRRLTKDNTTRRRRGRVAAQRHVRSEVSLCGSGSVNLVVDRRNQPSQQYLQLVELFRRERVYHVSLQRGDLLPARVQRL